MPLFIVRQDITKMPCDVIVNATNRHMTCDFGVSKAILDAAGEELNAWVHGFIDIGEVLVSPGFNLPCKHIVHIAGPVWRGGDFLEREQLALCYRNVLKTAVLLDANSVAVPLISSGSRGFPKDQVLDIAVETIAAFLMDNEIEIYLIVYDKNSYSIGKELFGDITEYIDDNYIEADEAKRESEYYRSQRSFAPRNPYCGRATRNKLMDNFASRACGELPKQKPVAAAPAASEQKKPSPIKNDDPIPAPIAASKYAKQQKPYDEADIHDILKHADDSFAKTLFKLIDARNISDVECYKKANVSRQTFHKIISDDSYRPSKTTVLAFAIALQLNLDETKHLLETVGFALSKSIRFDIIIEYFISREEYDIYKINDVLFKFDQVLLGV